LAVHLFHNELAILKGYLNKLTDIDYACPKE